MELSTLDIRRRRFHGPGSPHSMIMTADVLPRHWLRGAALVFFQQLLRMLYAGRHCELLAGARFFAADFFAAAFLEAVLCAADFFFRPPPLSFQS